VDIDTGTFPALEYSRRQLAIRLVTLVSAAGLILVAAVWIAGA